MSGRTVEVHADVGALSAAAAARFGAAARDAVARRGRFVVALAGGTTPRALYALLAAERASPLPWDRTEVFFGDERCVPPTDAASNYRTAHDALLGAPPASRARVHRIAGEQPPLQASEAYEAELRATLGAPDDRFDLVLLGMGADGHTLSLFAGSALLDERRHWVRPAVAPASYPQRERVTLTLPVVEAARCALFLVAGADKRDAVRRALAGDAELPAARVAAERTVWLCDAAAHG